MFIASTHHTPIEGYNYVHDMIEGWYFQSTDTGEKVHIDYLPPIRFEYLTKEIIDHVRIKRRFAKLWRIATNTIFLKRPRRAFAVWRQPKLDRMPSIMFPVIRQVFPELCAMDIVGVQPMTGDVGALFKLATDDIPEIPLEPVTRRRKLSWWAKPAWNKPKRIGMWEKHIRVMEKRRP